MERNRYRLVVPFYLPSKETITSLAEHEVLFYMALWKSATPKALEIFSYYKNSVLKKNIFRVMNP